MTPNQAAELAASIRTDFFGSIEAFGPAEAYAATELGQSDLANHLNIRLGIDRTTVIPWLDSFRSLNGARVLEVGAGTGSSTAGLAEQGALVTAVDVHAGALRVADLRCRLMGLDGQVRIVETNATALNTLWGPGDFDLIIFFACLEHMTLDERLESLTQAWALLSPGQHLVVIETPNRLWWEDDHTSLERFFHWLPDDLAIRYAPWTSRAIFNEQFSVPRPEVLVEFARWGRGASFHEFVLALDLPSAALPVSSCLQEYLGNPRWGSQTPDGQFMRLLRQAAPSVPAAFFFAYLDLALQR
jgi:2-polyprenyl-3-methyl-5-hydroxy-6-metoxy-1,4-benzoquinol methylase